MKSEESLKLDAQVLIVDDVPENIQVAMNILKEKSYNLSFATSGAQALELMNENHFDLILLDIMMPEMDGFEVCKKIKANKEWQDIPIIFLSAKVDIDSITKGFMAGAVDYITKPFHPSELLARVDTHIELYRSRLTLQFHNLSILRMMEMEGKRLLTELEDNQKEMIYVLTELMEATSDETGQHIRRVANISRLLAQYHPSLTIEDEEVIFHAAPMHDIGKIAIPYNILHKPGRLTETEFNMMKMHTTKAHEFLQHSSRRFVKAADIIAHEHHEKWDGTGYPRGLAGENIHLYGRIVALADVFDALTHRRQYKEAWSIDEAIHYIKERSGQQFDPAIINIFFKHIDEFVSIVKE